MKSQEELTSQIEALQRELTSKNRKLEIEAALERVRASSMAMHRSEELDNVVKTLAEKLIDLGISFDGALIFFFDKEKRSFHLWIATNHLPASLKVNMPYEEDMQANPVIRDLWEAIDTGGDFMNKSYYGNVKDDYFRFVDRHNALIIPEEVKKLHMEAESWIFSFTGGKHSVVGVDSWHEKRITPDEFKILKRFAKVFEQAYTRFLDLQKAEAQAREAQIEAALERVRARAMAMQKSDELVELIDTVQNELTKLDFSLNNCIFWLMSEEPPAATWWVGAVHKTSLPESYWVPFPNLPYFNSVYNAWQERVPKWVYELEGSDKEQADDYIFTQTDLVRFPDEVKHAFREPSRIYISFSFYNYGGLHLSTMVPLGEDQLEILNKFSKVFDMTYTRFKDLKQAEAQARESQIQLALEKVRSRSLAMHHSSELEQVVASLSDRFVELGLSFDGATIFLFEKEKRNIQLWLATTHLSAPVLIDLPYDKEIENNAIYKDMWYAIETGEHIINRSWPSETKNEYFRYVAKHNDESKVPESVRQFQLKTDSWTVCYAAEKNSLVGFDSWSGHITKGEDFKTLIRFAKVFEQAYIRFLDLQKAEANAKEAMRQAALDRIRADIASMRTISDLDRITPLIWNELTILGVPFIRCGIFIMDDEQQQIRIFLSTPDGKAIAAFHLPYSTPGNMAPVLTHWQEKKIYVDHWDEPAFQEFANTLAAQGAIASTEQYLQTIPHGGTYLHFLPFLQGMLYVGNTTRLSEEELKLIQSIADAFSTAYARYEDFNKLEAAKQQIEKTLLHLKQTQQQLIQAEKMASLGELTAGIAHEIQNPLNFVNNFSEVNKELLEELEQANTEGNPEEVKALAFELKENEEKISHHGKRADAIVKGMLQHSQQSSGQKEPTDINALAEEYLRLSYQAMRSKDKTFIAVLETHFDNSIGKINVVPQDLGRVLLNLFNNAFYTVHEKKQQLNNSFGPIVSVSTKKDNDKVEIIVKDNGNGIPEKVKEKIFQPFFTTKPTGEGTGLGLSLSYDIVKAHGGNIKVESKEGEGSEFIIRLPVRTELCEV